MASMSEMRIEPAPLETDEPSPPPPPPPPLPAPLASPPRHRCPQAFTYSDVLPIDPTLQGSHTPQQTPRAGYSSGYMSSSSNLCSVQGQGRTRPCLSTSTYGEEEEEMVSSGCSNRRQYSTIDNYHHPIFNYDIYSRLDHSATSTLTRHTPAHHHPTPSGSLLHTKTPKERVTLRPQHHPLVTNQLQYQSAQFHSRSPQIHSRSTEVLNVTGSTQLHSGSIPFHPGSAPHHSEYHSGSIPHHFESTSYHSVYHSGRAPYHSRRVPFRSGAQHLPRKKCKPLTPLASILRKMEGLEAEVKRRIVKVDQQMKRGEYEEAIPVLEAILMRVQQYPRLQLLLWEHLGYAEIAVGHYKKASICYLHHLAHCRVLNDFKGMTKAECNLGIAYMKMGLLKLAGRCFLQYLKNCRNLGEEWGVQSACSNLGLLSKSLALKNYQAAMERGEQEGAIAILTTCLRRAIIFFKQHLQVIQAHGDLEKQGRAYGNIGSCYELLRDYPEAIFYHQKRLEIVRAVGDMYSESCTLCNLGNCFRAKGNLDEALEHYLMNLEMAESVGDKHMEELMHMNLGITHELNNQLNDAIASYTLYLGMVVQSGELKKQVKGFTALARLYLETGQITKAHEYYVNLVRIFQQLGDRTSLNSAELHLKDIQRLLKQEKRRKKQESHTPPKKGRERNHTVSRASNLEREVNPEYVDYGCGLESRPRALQNKMGTWSGRGQRRRPQLELGSPTRLTSDSFVPDPLLVMADVSPSWMGQSTGFGTLPPSGPPFRLSGWSHDTLMEESPVRPRNHPMRASSLDSSMDDNRSISSSYSGEYDHLTPSPQDHTRHNHTHSFEVTANYNEEEEESGTITNCETTPCPSLFSDDDDDDLTTGRSTALPPFPSSPSTPNTPLEREGQRQREESGECSDSEEELTDEEFNQQHMRELERAGLELARAGLELAGYEGLEELGIEEGADKEWEQWQRMNEEERGFGSMISVAGVQYRKKPQQQKSALKAAASAPNI